jgi:hypothetical protein
MYSWQTQSSGHSKQSPENCGFDRNGLVMTELALSNCGWLEGSTLMMEVHRDAKANKGGVQYQTTS